MIEEKALERLHNSEDFLAFLNYVAESREWCISQMHDVGTDRLQQLSGRILALDEVLSVGKHKELKGRFSDLRR